MGKIFHPFPNPESVAFSCKVENFNFHQNEFRRSIRISITWIPANQAVSSPSSKKAPKKNPKLIPKKFLN
jgi:hypothetical protein